MVSALGGRVADAGRGREFPDADEAGGRRHQPVHRASAVVLVVAHGALFRALRGAMGHEPNVRTRNAVPVVCTARGWDGRLGAHLRGLRGKVVPARWSRPAVRRSCGPWPETNPLRGMVLTVTAPHDTRYDLSRSH